MNRFVLPVLALAALIVLFAVGLQRDPRIVPSPLIGKPAPAFRLPPLGGPGRFVSPQDWAGAPIVVNYWASWCTPCLEEQPLLLEKAAAGARIAGINYKDQDSDAVAWLSRHGNPFSQVLVDAEGSAGLDWGVYGVPETYVVDAVGVIRFKHVGPLTRETWDRDVAPLLGRPS
jgi:cytochrome c biogenesis protein CcmG/thiol:disulfide interchange protein DsbE